MNHSAKLHSHLLAASLLLSGATVACLAAESGAHHADMSLVPPPPPTPALAIPPAPIELPYSYALNATGLVPEQPAVPKAVPTQRPPAPFQLPAPLAARPVNSPNLNVSYAFVRGFGAPRVTYAAASGESTPGSEAGGNTWFDASLRWYAQRVSSQQFFNGLQNRDASPMPSTAMVSVSSAPPVVTPPSRSTHVSHKIMRHFRHARKVIVTR